MVDIITMVDSYLCKIAPGPLRIDRAVAFLGVDHGILTRLFNFYLREGAFRKIEELICPTCDRIVEKEISGEELFCDICEQYSPPSELEAEWVYHVKAAPMTNCDAGRKENEEAMVEVADEYQRNRIERWNNLNVTRFLHESKTFGESERKEILENVQSYGICQFRMIAQSAEEELLLAMERLIGPAFEEQNDHKGKIKTLRPSPTGAAHSGETSKDLGLHVDGTQHNIQPAMLIFQFIAEPKYGADSIFVDTASALFDMDKTIRQRIMTKLARPNAATFSKKGMTYTGSIFSWSPIDTIICRVRFDEVIQVNPSCQPEFELFQEQVHKDKYKISFKPIEGDILIFDNWRLLHARDEVFGQRTREHRRMWLYNLRPHLQSNYKIGIRPLPIETLAAIKQANESAS
jgi:alpha-ketoglutarate-dependent taurine dioxygenase